MKIYTSYFYQIRFFSKNMVPFSTAKWDPKWFHDFKGSNNLYLDKNGIVNGIRATPLLFPEDKWEILVQEGKECTGPGCSQELPCSFMKLYAEYLDTIDCKKFIERCEEIAYNAQKRSGFEEEPIIVFIVHEKSTCPCAERPVIQEWLKKNGYEVSEWERKENYEEK